MMQIFKSRATPELERLSHESSLFACQPILTTLEKRANLPRLKEKSLQDKILTPMPPLSLRKRSLETLESFPYALIGSKLWEQNLRRGVLLMIKSSHYLEKVTYFPGLRILIPPSREDRI